MRIVIETYPNLPNGEHQTGEDIIQAILAYAKSAGVYAHVKDDKHNQVTRIDVTKSSREVVDITGLAANYLLEAAAMRGVSVETLIKELASDD